MTDQKRRVLNSAVMATLFFGFSSGLPLATTSGTLQGWLKSEGIDLTLIGIFNLVGLPYTLKFIWAPLIDRFVPPFLGRRRGWILISQIFIILGLIALGLSNPMGSLTYIAGAALFVSFFSASQDIVLDAHRRDTLETRELGLGSSLFITGYRLGMLVSGALAIYLSAFMSWQSVYFFISGCMLIGVVTNLIAPEPPTTIEPPKTIRAAVIDPFLDFFTRRGATEILLFILLYKLADTLAMGIQTAFILDIGFSREELGAVAKICGLIATIVGGLIGGTLITRIGIRRALWSFGILQTVANLGFSILALIGHNIYALASAISVENLTSGMGTSAFLAFMASLCNKRFSATQYALLTSLMAIPRVILASSTGYLAGVMGWPLFYGFCTVMGVPGLLLLLRAHRWEEEEAGLV